MPSVVINYWAVIVATLAAMFIGWLWYLRPVFGNVWMRLSGMTEEKAKAAMGKSYFGMLVLAFVVSYVLAHIVSYAGATTVSKGLMTGFWVWLGFVFAIQGGTYLFEQRPMKLFFINAGYNLVQLLVMSAILASWH